MSSRSGSTSSSTTTTFRPTRLLATIFVVHLIACVTDPRPRRPQRRRDNPDGDILEELGYVNLLSGRPRFLTPGGRYSTRPQDLHVHNHKHHHDQRTRFHPHHAYDDQLSRTHPHHQNPHKSLDMTMQYVSPKDTTRVTNNTLLRDHLLNSPTKVVQMRSRVLPSHRPRGSPGGPSRRRQSTRGGEKGGGISVVAGGKGVQRRHTV